MARPSFQHRVCLSVRSSLVTMAAEQGGDARPKLVFDDCRVAFVQSRQLSADAIEEVC